ncbi:hypothetical protein A7K94_0201215 [Modestobacter sp. VKM Ac-2676]|nr:hypothetical protein A7K94_0201215 [Modestobacter sp. VKM Ac-2676]
MYELAPLLPHGVVRRDELTLATSSSSVARWLRTGELVLAHAGVVVLPDRAQEWAVRARAATLWARGPLSHLSALAAAGLTEPPRGPIHVTVPADRFPRGCPDVVVHRTELPMGPTQGFAPPRLPVARSLVDAWTWAHTPRRNPRASHQQPVVRHLVIECVRRRDVRVLDLRRASDRQPTHAGRLALCGLLDLIEDGCQSELEIFGVTHVLRIPGIPAPVQQHRVFLPNGRYVDLDAAYLTAKVGIELDGAAFHGSAEDRERDTRRDAALAALGWITLRFSYRRLTGEPDACRLEIEAVVRRRMGG